MNHNLAIDQNPKSVSELRAIFSTYFNDLFAPLHDERSCKIPASVLQYALALEQRLRRIIDRYFDQLDRLAALCVFPNGEVCSPATLNILAAAQKILCSAMLSDICLHADPTLTADTNLNAITDLIQQEADTSCFFYTNPSDRQPTPDLTILDDLDQDPQNGRRWPPSAEHDPDDREVADGMSAGHRSAATPPLKIPSKRSLVPLARRTTHLKTGTQRATSAGHRSREHEPRAAPAIAIVAKAAIASAIS